MVFYSHVWLVWDVKPFLVLLGWNVIISASYVGGTDTRALADGQDWSQNSNKDELKSYSFSHSCETCVRCLISSFRPLLTSSWVVHYIHHPLHIHTPKCTRVHTHSSLGSYWMSSAKAVLRTRLSHLSCCILHCLQHWQGHGTSR